MKVLIATFFIVLFDQITKLYVKGVKIPILGIDVPGMPYQSSISVYGDFFKITFIENPGMAFGLQIGGKLFLSLFTILATLLLFVFLYKNRKESLLLRLALAFILGGAIGNLIDRVFYGKIYDYAPIFYGRVVDFLHFDFPNFTIFGKNIYSWPIFNIADIFVTIGFLMILFGYKKIFHTENEANIKTETPLDNTYLNTGDINSDKLNSDLAFSGNSEFNSYSENNNPESDINSAHNEIKLTEPENYIKIEQKSVNDINKDEKPAENINSKDSDLNKKTG
ncbi:MAG TPA: signal peptidase II [Ignavibacteria bacterium]|nr:signal peptidase II [Ignavibacteria bacterium]